MADPSHDMILIDNWINWNSTKIRPSESNHKQILFKFDGSLQKNMEIRTRKVGIWTDLAGTIATGFIFQTRNGGLFSDGLIFGRIPT